MCDLLRDPKDIRVRVAQTPNSENEGMAQAIVLTRVPGVIKEEGSSGLERNKIENEERQGVRSQSA